MPPAFASRFLFVIAAWLCLCGGMARAADSQTYSLSDGRQTRSYRLYRPAQLDPHQLGPQSPVPLVIVLHGGFGSGLQAERAYLWDDKADAEGFVVVYPDGIRHSWNAGGACCGPAQKDNVDDIAFLNRLIETVTHTQNIDPKRIYLTGMSNGAAMAYRYGCEGNIAIAAIGSVSGSLAVSCSPHPVSVMEIHGLDDQKIPFKGGIGSQAISKVPWIGVERTLSLFSTAAGCPALTSRHDDSMLTTIAHCPKGIDIALIGIKGAGHQWPGSRQRRPFWERIGKIDRPSDAIDATNTLWDFFKNHPAKTE